MSLHNGIDTCSWVSLGLYSEESGLGEESTLAHLYVSLGMLEDAALSLGRRHYWPFIWGYPWRKIDKPYD